MSKRYKEIRKCRICDNPDLADVLHLGNQALTGVFPSSVDQLVTSGPLELVKCVEDGGINACGLVQLRQSYDLEEMFGDNYGYRSGLNRTMATHLAKKVDAIRSLVTIGPGDLVIDIGSNDGTLLGYYPTDGITLVGIDPTASRFAAYYPGHIQAVPEFFSSSLVRERFGRRKAKVVTSIAMFYDLENPLDFMRQVSEILADDGIWVFEQSYMPMMLDATAYDTICHEHLEYYRLKQIKWMVEDVGLEILDVEFNDINGGSFSVVAAKSGAPYKQISSVVAEVLREEEALGLGTIAPYHRFRDRVQCHRDELRELIARITDNGEKIIGYGASTKGNVILQFCNITPKDMPYIAEVNEDKYGCFTPGTHIPIISEAQAKSHDPDYLMVLPWHFRDFFLEKEARYLESGGRLVFPLPSIEIVSS